MKMTNKVISDFIHYYNLDDPMYIPHLLGDPWKIREIISDHFADDDPVGKLPYEDLLLLSQEHCEFLEKRKNELHNLCDVEVHITSLLKEIAFNEMVSRFSEEDTLVSLLEESLKDVAA